ncbi:hypothetical protein WMY93_005665 [Mugilogobius chulae]|uniref:Uncharacterized protein n=1 Tax=Mugilogobius chulae TaxID=88201 RepID=A0AAW0PHS3_9GOBI
MADSWNYQLKRKENIKKMEEKKDIHFLKEQTKKELEILEEERQNAKEKRLREKQLMEDNAKLMLDRSVLARRRRKNELEAEKRDAHLQSLANPTYEDYVEQEISKAKAENRIVIPLLAEKKKQEARDSKMYVYRPGMCEAVPKKITLETQRLKNIERQHCDFDDGVRCDESLYLRSGSRCENTQKYGTTEESRKIKERVERQHVAFGNVQNCERKPARAQKRLAKNIPTSQCAQSRIEQHFDWQTHESSEKYDIEEEDYPRIIPRKEEVALPRIEPKTKSKPELIMVESSPPRPNVPAATPLYKLKETPGKRDPPCRKSRTKMGLDRHLLNLLVKGG